MSENDRRLFGKGHKYQPYLSPLGSGSSLKDGLMKIRWKLCKKEDLEKFKANIATHTLSIELLLTTINL